jgi:TetR/AcrR family transcriptional regulator, transcriptional repressor for nem operon
MPYTAEHKARTRARIIEKARVMFNHRGFEQVSIDDVMREAGLTRGGFYNHFASKDELYSEAVRSFRTCNPFATQAQRLKENQREPMALARMLINLYLSDETLEDIDTHCPLIALPSDVARSGLKPRAAYTEVVESMRGVFKRALGEGKEAQRRSLLIVNLCVGGMVIARTTHDPELRKSIRAASRSEALSLLER